MEVKEISPSLPKGGWLRRACQCRRQNSWWMSSYSWRGRLDRKKTTPITSSYCRRCSSMPQSKGRKRKNVWSTKATDMAFQSWTPKQTYLPSSWYGPRPAGRSSNPYTMRYTNSRGYWGLPQRPRTCSRGVVLLRRPPGAERGQNAMDNWRTQSNWCLAPKKLDPQEGEEGCLHGKEPCWGEISPPEGSGYGSHLGRRNRVAELPPHQELVGGLSPFPKQGPLQT